MEPTIGYGPVVSASRRLLARVRDVMANSDAAQSRLERISEIIAADMVAEVCSIYVRRAGEVLELFATKGLKPSAVHNTRLRFGEGIVGDIAASGRPFALDDAQAHPNFAYRPETGEESFHSMMGVPVLRGGRVVGVVAVQNRIRRQYSEEEVETLQTVAMVLAELIAGSDLIPPGELTATADQTITSRPHRIEGIILNGGMGLGTAVLHMPHLRINRFVADDPDAEHQRLREAFQEMHGALDEMLSKDVLAAGGEHRDILETYKLIAEDAGWLARIEEAIRTGLTAEAAVQKVRNDIRVRMGQISDPYLRERVHDLDDLAHRLTAHLLDDGPGGVVKDLPEDAILIARNMGPGQLLDYDAARLKGLVLEEGSPTSHVAIIARALDIPVVGHARDILTRLDEGDQIIVDADHGQVFLRPGEDVLAAFEESKAAFEARRLRYQELRDQPAVSVDGVPIKLDINAGLMIDLTHMEESNADGIGLFRTEIQFMTRSKLLGVDEQTTFYTQVLDSAGDKPVVFRTLDIGGDKILPHWSGADGENPAMGWRAIRVGLDRPALLRQQLRALLRAAAGRELRVMFPMIAEVAELEAARRLLDREIERERRGGRPLPEKIRVGVMLEVPSLAFQLPALLKRVDFVSVGSNDLGQFLFAQDRGDPRLADRYDMLSPIILRFLGDIVVACETHGVPLCLCGEMASRPIEAMALLGLGFRHLSMSPAAIGPVKAMVRSLAIGPLEELISSLYEVSDRSTRETLRAFAMERNVVI